ncbi:MAG: hypothetical protein ACYTF1_11885 [Planctomycetota bacterium]|jgi:hypothetical protein
METFTSEKIMEPLFDTEKSDLQKNTEERLSSQCHTLVTEQQLRSAEPSLRSVPIVQSSLIYCSAILALVFMILSASEGVEELLSANISWMQFIGQHANSFALFVISLTAFGVVILWYCGFRFLHQSLSLINKKVLLVIVMIVAFALLVLPVINRFFLEGAFGSGSKEPSFIFPPVLCQVWILLAGLAWSSSVLDNKTNRTDLVSWGIRLVIGILALCAFVTIIQAVTLDGEKMFDVGVAVGVGTYFFWLIYCLIVFVLQRGEKELNDELIPISSLFLPLFFFYSKDATNWSVASIAIICVLGLSRQLRFHTVAP